MSAEDVLVDAAERGWAAAESEMERKTILDMVKVFKQPLLAKIRADDAAGILATVYVLRDGKALGTGMVMTLEDRALFGWMKGFLKKPVVEEVALAAITDVTRSVKEPSGRVRDANRAIFVEAGARWELLCGRTDLPDEPVYELVAGLLGGTLKIDDLAAVGDSADSGAR